MEKEGYHCRILSLAALGKRLSKTANPYNRRTSGGKRSEDAANRGDNLQKSREDKTRRRFTARDVLTRRASYPDFLPSKVVKIAHA